MLAFVLSGGGNRGAIQVGALQVLLEAGIRPDLVVGTSVGAVNAAGFALDPTVRGTYELANVWRSVTHADVYPGNRLTALWNLLRGREGLFSNQAWYNFLSSIFAGKCFGDFTECQLRVVATDLETARMVTFGDDPNLPVVDALMASTALPPLHPPWTIQGRKYIDGGAVADLPLRVALDLGARTIFALNIVRPTTPGGQLRNAFEVARQAVSALVQRQMSVDLEHTRRCKGVCLYEITLPVDLVLQAQDFSHTDELIEMGREITKAFLANSPVRQPKLSDRVATGISRVSGPLWATATTLIGARRLKPRPVESEAGLQS
jgi:NTE family protein